MKYYRELEKEEIISDGDFVLEDRELQIVGSSDIGRHPDGLIYFRPITIESLHIEQAAYKALRALPCALRIPSCFL